MMRMVARSAGVLLAIAVLAGGSHRVSLAQDQSGTLAVTGVRLIDGTGRAAIENATLIVRDGRVQEVGSSSVKIPPGATRINGSGKTTVPGLINSHGHIDAARSSTVPVRDKLLPSLRVYAQAGVTTAYSLGSGPSDAAEGLKLRDEQEHGALDRARLYTAGPVIAD